MPNKCGLDHTLHARFLRACCEHNTGTMEYQLTNSVFYTLLQACVVLPSVLTMSRAGIPADSAGFSFPCMSSTLPAA